MILLTNDPTAQIASFDVASRSVKNQFLRKGKGTAEGIGVNKLFYAHEKGQFIIVDEQLFRTLLFHLHGQITKEGRWGLTFVSFIQSVKRGYLASFATYYNVKEKNPIVYSVYLNKDFEREHENSIGALLLKLKDRITKYSETETFTLSTKNFIINDHNFFCRRI